MTEHAAKFARSEIDALLAEAARRLVEAAHPERVILFGSYARGDFTHDSDLDFLVILPQISDRHAEMLRLQDALAPLGYPTDVLVYSAQEVAERGHLPGSALRWALEEGKTLYAAV